MIPLVNPFFAPLPLAALVAVAPRGAAAGRFAPHKAQGAAKSRPLGLMVWLAGAGGPRRQTPPPPSETERISLAPFLRRCPFARKA